MANIIFNILFQWLFFHEILVKLYEIIETPKIDINKTVASFYNIVQQYNIIDDFDEKYKVH